MDPYDRERLDRINREAELEKAPDDPEQPADSRDARPLIAMICGALAVTVIVLGVMWVNNTRYDGASPRPVAEQPQPRQ
jgi:hypothetical protein